MAEIKDTLLSNQEEDSDSFLSETSARICSRNEHAVPATGKWVLFCHDLTLKRIWPEICDLYRNDQMEGIEVLESSPEECSSRLHGHGWGMVTFICGPCDKFELVLKYGMNLLKLLHRCVGSFDVDCLYYTHETLTALTTRDDDDNNPQIKADFEIEIPKKWRSDNHLTLLSRGRNAGTLHESQSGPLILPMEEKSQTFVIDSRSDLVNKYEYAQCEGGKWMLMYQNLLMDYMWMMACHLYRAGHLPGVRWLKAITNKRSLRQSTDDVGVILFHCGPSTDQDLVKSYGRTILEKMHDFGQFHRDHMSYKTDEQTASGKRSIGKNSTYMLTIPEEWRSTDYKTSQWEGSTSTDELPSQVFDKDWLFEQDIAISSKWPMDRANNGQWILVYEVSCLDRAWKKVRNLYRAGELPGIQSLMVSTAAKNARGTGCILCHCGPRNELELIKTYGKSLVSLVGYCDSRGKMEYRCSGDIFCCIEVPIPWMPRSRGGKKASTRTTSAADVCENWRRK